MATIIGNDINNWLIGSNGNDYIKGFGGDDALKGGGGADQLWGGAGIDTAMYGDSQSFVWIDLMWGYGDFGDAEGDQFFSIENVSGSPYGDTLTGDNNANRLEGLNGVDYLTGNGGSDVLDGGYDDDVLDGGAGADTLIGGEGRDLAEYGRSPGSVHVSLIDNIGLFNDADGDSFSGIEDIHGSFHWDDVLIGDHGDNVLDGLYGDDILHGLGGADILIGGGGANTMVGGGGNDVYYVENGADQVVEAGGEGIDTVVTYVSYVLTAGADVETLNTENVFGTSAIDLTGNASGNDIIGNNGRNVLNGGDARATLTGVGGQDSFLFDAPLNGAVNVDRITDFNVADDTILLDNAIFSSSLGLGNISSGEFVVGAAAQDANDRIIYNSGTGALYYDSDGNGGIAQVQFATLSTGLALTYLDFYVV